MLRKFALMCVAVLLGLAALPLASEAAISSCGTASNYFDGFWNQNTGFGAAEIAGVAAWSIPRSGAMCSTNSSQFTTAWVMVSGQVGQRYSQSGFMTVFGGCTRHFAEYNNNAGFTRTFVGGACPSGVLGSAHQYLSAWNYGCLCIQNWVDSTLVSQTNFNPLTFWTRPFRPIYSGETIYKESDMPGGATATTPIDSMQVMSFSGNIWSPTPCYLTGVDSPLASSRWNRVPAGCTHFDIWTT